ncbi:hypothetical protein [Ornithinimicrobium avium]|uniref:hypothetical protein n=1 Tax=Ornithinimicrobium avium TaxID=2283195 RepID=UPI0013B42779|nr:hypothetical protein [Ornithinimicrobium avium]
MNDAYLLAYDPIPEEVASWLAANDWTKLTNTPGSAALWTRGGEEILQPLLRNASDYELRMRDMFRIISDTRQDSAEAIAQEMVAEGSDVVEWRASLENSRDYSLPLDDGLALIQGVRNAFVAAANATVQRRGYFGHSTLKVAREHARVVQMGQTRRGSYVVPIISRIPGVMESHDSHQSDLGLEFVAQPFERRVIARLASALTVITEMAVQSGREPTQSQLNESVAEGVSHELCSAVAGALKAESFDAVDISFRWASRLSGHPNVKNLDLPRNAAPIIHRMAERLRGSEVVGEQLLVGFVRSHRREPGEEDGIVYIRTALGDQMRTVALDVSPAQLHDALVAADQNRPVSVRGRLARAPGRTWRFESVSEFRIADAGVMDWG